MVDLVGFPIVGRAALKPGDGFVADYEGRLIYGVQGEHYPYLLLGGGGPPRPLGGTLGGYLARLPGAVQLRPIRDRPWSLSWTGTPAAGDIVLHERGAFLRVQGPRGRSEFNEGWDLIDLRTGSTPGGNVTGPVFRGWEMVCFPLPNRPMTLGVYDPLLHPAPAT